jgi:hypothetical protein
MYIRRNYLMESISNPWPVSIMNITLILAQTRDSRSSHSDPRFSKTQAIYDPFQLLFRIV